MKKITPSCRCLRSRGALLYAAGRLLGAARVRGWPHRRQQKGAGCHVWYSSKDSFIVGVACQAKAILANCSFSLAPGPTCYDHRRPPSTGTCNHGLRRRDYAAVGLSAAWKHPGEHKWQCLRPQHAAAVACSRGAERGLRSLHAQPLFVGVNADHWCFQYQEGYHRLATHGLLSWLAVQVTSKVSAQGLSSLRA
jgi:hypothetical protein